MFSLRTVVLIAFCVAKAWRELVFIGEHCRWFRGEGELSDDSAVARNKSSNSMASLRVLDLAA